MPRPQRIELAGAYYHVMNRGRGRRAIFHGDDYHLAFLHTLSEAHQRFGVEIHAYCLMRNHYHLLLATPRGNLSRAMRHINGLYTQRYNRLAQTDGPLFRGRFKAVLVDEDNYLLQVGRYIHRNPVATRRPLVERLEDYRWSSYPAYLNRVKAPSWLYRQPTYALLGHRQRYAQYKAYVESGVDEEIAAFYGKARRAPVLGDDAFKERMSKKEWRNVSPEALRRQVYGPPNVEDILAAVCRVFGVNEATLMTARRGQRNEARWIAMYLCQQIGGMSLPAIAERFGLRHMSGVSHQIRRLKEEVQRDRQLEIRLQALIQGLTP